MHRRQTNRTMYRNITSLENSDLYCAEPQRQKLMFEILEGVEEGFKQPERCNGRQDIAEDLPIEDW